MELRTAVLKAGCDSIAYVHLSGISDAVHALKWEMLVNVL